MSIMWRLVNVSKGQHFSLMLCALCLIVQWSCRCSAGDPNPTANDVPSRNESTLNNSIVTAPPDVSNDSALSSAENSSTQLMPDVTKMPLKSFQTVPNDLHHGESISTTLSSTTDSKSFNGENGANAGKQGNSQLSETGQPVVLISLLTCGLILAAMLLAAYYFKSKQSWSPQSKRLDEEPDAQDHDSTIFSVASEDQSDAHEKPKLNGEAQENGENQRPVAAAAATGNGHQRKIIEEADTEL